MVTLKRAQKEQNDPHIICHSMDFWKTCKLFGSKNSLITLQMSPTFTVNQALKALFFFHCRNCSTFGNMNVSAFFPRAAELKLALVWQRHRKTACMAESYLYLIYMYTSWHTFMGKLCAASISVWCVQHCRVFLSQWGCQVWCLNKQKTILTTKAYAVSCTLSSVGGLVYA